MFNFVLKGDQISVLLMGFDNFIAVLDPCESTQCVNGDCTTLLTSSDPVCVCAEYYSGDLCETRMSFVVQVWNQSQIFIQILSVYFVSCDKCYSLHKCKKIRDKPLLANIRVIYSIKYI